MLSRSQLKSRLKRQLFFGKKTVLVNVCFSPKTVLVDVNEVRSGIVVTLTWPKLGPALKYELLSSLGQSWVFDAEASCRTLVNRPTSIVLC